MKEYFTQFLPEEQKSTQSIRSHYFAPSTNEFMEMRSDASQVLLFVSIIHTLTIITSITEYVHVPVIT